LPLRLRKKHQFLISLVAMSQVTRVPCNLLMEKGQTIKIVNLFVIWARNNNYVVTVEPLPKVDFKGGQVLSPKKRFWMYRVFTLGKYFLVELFVSVGLAATNEKGQILVRCIRH
jgi:hypothetical protein